jgi:low affinity Fe/Cu permease
MDRIFTRVATRIAGAAGQPQTCILAMLLIIIWGASGPLFGFSDTWQLVVNTVTSIVTFLMVFLIQNSQNRDGAAIQAKLDELVRASGGARPQFIGIEHMTDNQLEELRNALEHECGIRSGDKPPPSDTVERLLDRYQ